MKNILISSIFIVLTIYFFWTYRVWYFSDSFRLIFFDVGQGDSILIIAPKGLTILVDGGPDTKVLRGLGKVLPFWRRKIDLLVVTHSHDDHVTGLVEVSKRYRILKVLHNNLNFNTPVLSDLLKSFKKNKITLINSEVGMFFKLGNDCNLSVLASDKNLKVNENDRSIVTMLSCLNKMVLLSGDAGTEVEKKLLENNSNIKTDILKISHHGSISASSQEFLISIKPKIAVVSVGVNNRFNHPSPLILERLSKLNINLYQTAKLGLIEFLASYSVIKLVN